MIKNLAIGGGSSRTLLLAAVVLGVLSAVLIGVFLSQLDKGNSGGTGGATAPAVVAAQDIPALTRITAEMVTVRQLPQDVVLPGAFPTADSLLGQVTQVPVTAGEQVLSSKVTSTGAALTGYGANPPASLVVPQGMRAFAVALSKVAAAGGLVRPGDFVDVVLSRGTSSDASAALVPGAACYVLQDIEVLAVGQQLKNVGQGDANSLASATTNPDASTATLSVTPEQVWMLAAAQQSVGDSGVGNQLWLALRPFGERGDNGGLPRCNVAPGS